MKPKRIAAIYDIHGNFPALEAVLAEVRQLNVDLVMVGGDILPGPMPRATIDCLRSLDFPVKFISGNGERETLALKNGAEPVKIPERYREAMRWVARQLRADDEQWISSWPKTNIEEMEGLGEVMFCHATPRNDFEIFTRLTTEENLRPVFAGVTAQIVICGHSHMQSDRMVGSIRVLNAGSVGMPFGATGAYWLLLGPGIELRRTDYDLAKAAERVRATEYPQAEEFAGVNILAPPSEEQILKAFTPAELK